MGNKAQGANLNSKKAENQPVNIPTNQNQPKPNNQAQPAQDKPIFDYNPTQLAKDQQGRLHPKWSQIIKRSQQKHKPQTQKLVNQIAKQTQLIGQQCNKRYTQDEGKLVQCLRTVAEPIWRIQKKGQKEIMKLGQVANKCLLNDKKEEECVEQVRKHLHKVLEDTLRQMKKIKVEGL